MENSWWFIIRKHSRTCAYLKAMFPDCPAGAPRVGLANEWLDNAVWLIKCLEQREDIIFAIAREICELRGDFFKTGPRAFRHIDKCSFASRVCLHESILDKALAGKYLQCRWGLYELKSFFREA